MLFHTLTYGSVFSCVELSTGSQYSTLSLKKKKKELDIVHRKEYKELTSLAEDLKGQKHVFLIVNDERVLTKNVGETHIANESVVKAAFPNISLNDFYYDVLEMGSSSLVSICRKEVIQNIIDEFSEQGISVVQFSLGNNAFQKLLPFLNDFSFYTSNGVFDVENHEISSWKKQKPVSKTYDVNGLNVTTSEMLPLAGVLSYYQGVEVSQEDEIRKTIFSAYKQKRIFQLGVRFGLGFLFVSLLINFFVFTSYRGKVSKVKEELAISQVYKKQLVSLDEIVGKKKQLLESMNAASNSKVIWYVDEIARSVPNTISLNQMKYQPLTRAIRKDKVVMFSSDKMVISGDAKNDTDLTLWLSELENQEWIHKVVVNLGGEKVRSTSFDLLVHLNFDNL